jgi:hypothetical protein
METDNLLIVYGNPLAESFLESKKIEPITEEHFTSLYLRKKNEYKRLGFDEFRTKNKKVNRGDNKPATAKVKISSFNNYRFVVTEPSKNRFFK